MEDTGSQVDLGHGANAIRRERPRLRSQSKQHTLCAGLCCCRYTKRAAHSNSSADREHASHAAPGSPRHSGSRNAQTEHQRRLQRRGGAPQDRSNCCSCANSCTCELLVWKLWIQSQWPTLKSFTEEVCDSTWFKGFTTACTTYALFGDDIRVAWLPKSADTAFEVLSSIVFFTFILEMLILAHCKRDYMLPLPWKPTTQWSNRVCGGVTSRQVGSFYFWMDFLATISLLTELPWLVNLPVYESPDVTIVNGEEASSLGVSGSNQDSFGRVIRLLRLMRIFRVARAYKHCAQLIHTLIDRYRNSDEGGTVYCQYLCSCIRKASDRYSVTHGGQAPDNKMHDNYDKARTDGEGNLTIRVTQNAEGSLRNELPEVADSNRMNLRSYDLVNAAHRHFTQVLSSVFGSAEESLEMIDAKQSTALKKFSSKAGSYSESLGTDSRIGATLNDLTTQRVIIGVLLMAVGFNLLTFEETRATNRFVVGSVHQLSQTSNQESLSLSIEGLKDLANPPLLTLVVDGNVEVSDSLSPLRNYEIGKIEYITDDGGGRTRTIARFDHREPIRNLAELNIGLTFAIIGVLLFAALSFYLDVSALILRPVRDMVSVVKSISQHPLRQLDLYEMVSPALANAVRDPSRNSDQAFEIVYLTRMFLAIGDLLRMGFGETGARIITQKLNRQGELDVLSEASTVNVVLVHFRLNEEPIKDGASEAVERKRNRAISEIHQVIHKHKGSILSNGITGVYGIWKVESQTSDEPGNFETPRESIADSDGVLSEGGPESTADDASESSHSQSHKPSATPHSTVFKEWKQDGVCKMMLPTDTNVNEQWKQLGKRVCGSIGSSTSHVKMDGSLGSLPYVPFIFETPRWLLGPDDSKETNFEDSDTVEFLSVSLKTLQQRRGHKAADRALLAATEITGRMYAKFSTGKEISGVECFPITVGIHLAQSQEAVLGSSRKLDAGVFSRDLPFSSSLSASASERNLVIMLSGSIHRYLSAVPRTLCHRVVKCPCPQVDSGDEWLYTLYCEFQTSSFQQRSIGTLVRASIIPHSEVSAQDEISSSENVFRDPRDKPIKQVSPTLMALSPSDTDDLVVFATHRNSISGICQNTVPPSGSTSSVECPFYYARLQFRRHRTKSDTIRSIRDEEIQSDYIKHSGKSGRFRKFLQSFREMRNVKSSSALSGSELEESAPNEGTTPPETSEFDFFDSDKQPDSPLIWLFDVNLLRFRARDSLIFRLWYDLAMHLLYSEHESFQHTVLFISRLKDLALLNNNVVHQESLALELFRRAQSQYPGNDLCAQQISALRSSLSSELLNEADNLSKQSDQAILSHGFATSKVHEDMPGETLDCFENTWAKSMQCVLGAS